MQDKINFILRKVEKFIPRKVYKFFQPAYHYGLATIGAIRYGFPSRKIKVIAITGTKGKSSTTEFVNAILEEAGYKTSILSTIRFKIGDETKKNLFKMTMPGRFFVQKFLHDSVTAKCDYAIIEMTSEGARFFRHTHVSIDYLLVTNITPEHIESHGSYEKYLECKLRIASQLKNSSKKEGVKKVIITTDTQPDLQKFHNYKVDKNITINTSDLSDIDIFLPGDFNKVNAKLALTLASEIDIDEDVAKRAVKNLKNIAGRADEVKVCEEQKFKVVIDYAHTVDSLEKIYSAYPGYRIGVLGSCGGGRDKAKRPQLGAAADRSCEIVIVTDEDPYDDDVMEIMNDVAGGINAKSLGESLFINPDRRDAIALAIQKAKKMAEEKENVSVIVTGKGTDPYIMRANNKKEKWSDRDVAEEELKKLFGSAQQ